MLPIRLDRTRLLQAVIAALTAWVAAAPAAHAQAKLDARYTVTLGGIPVGRGGWVVDLSENQYSAAANGMATGLIKLFAGGSGTTYSRGDVVNGQLQPRDYAATLTISKKKDEVGMTIENGNVKEYTAKPPSTPDPERVAITEAHRRGVNDPMTASLIRVSGSGDPISADTCKRTLAIFDGRMRYDLRLSFKRMEKVKAEKGYQGPAVVCAVSFVPIAGYIPDRPVVKYLTSNQDMEIWLVPIAGTRIAAPFRISVPTPFGDAVMEATQFMAGPRAPANAKAL